MKQIFKITLLLLIVNTAFGQTANKITMEDLWQNYKFYAQYVPGFNFMQDGNHYTRLEENSIVMYSITEDNTKEPLLDGFKIKDQDGFSGKISNYSFSDDEEIILISTENEKIYRHSSVGLYFIYDRKTEKLTAIRKDFKIRDVSLDPTNKKVAYVYENNLYYKNLDTGEEIQVTTDGEKNKIINGVTDWVYEEEFGFTKAYEWNANGTAIAYIRFDETEVPEFTMTNYTGAMYPEYVTFKYPKVGEKNAVVKPFIYQLDNHESQEIKISNDYEYIPRLKWTNDPSTLILFTMNRHQNKLYLNQVDVETLTTSILLEEESKYYVDIHDNLTFLPKKKGFLWTSEKDGYNHIYWYTMKGKLKKQLTTGPYDVTAFYGYDKKRNKIYYQAAKVNPTQREVYQLDMKKSISSIMTPLAGTNKAQFSSTFDYYTLNYSNANQAPIYTVVTNRGKTLKTLVDNNRVNQLMNDYETSKVEFTQIPTDDNIMLNAYIIKPNNFDENKKYPVLMYAYGGPGSQTVTDSYGSQNYWWFQSLAQDDYVIVSVDNRGTGARGEEFKKMTYLELGKYEITDQINAAKYLAAKDWVDESRIGMFGWSFGGYMASLAITKGADIFKSTIAVAPVTNWKWYDSVYTERYMRTRQENENGFENNSPINFVDLLKGNYLLIHGQSDDNVHFQHTAEMANALIRAEKQFDTYFYPNRNHGIYGNGARYHLYTKMTNFIKEKL